jgi:hypothetical protein
MYGTNSNGGKRSAHPLTNLDRDVCSKERKNKSVIPMMSKISMHGEQVSNTWKPVNQILRLTVLWGYDEFILHRSQVFMASLVGTEQVFPMVHYSHQVSQNWDNLCL